jgi:glycosyltransferase involved in cell wall biosynthesis
MHVQSVAVITGSTGSALLAQAVRSVVAQDLPAGVTLQHWIVVDGNEYEASTRALLETIPSGAVERRVLVLPENTGGSGYVCHRINGALPWLVDTEYVCFLDQDNAYAPNHLYHLLRSLSQDSSAWAHSLRSIIDANGTPLCVDSCESLGGVSHTVLGRQDRLVDTNCFLLRRDVAIEVGQLWHVKAREPGKLEGDRAVTRYLLERYPRYGISRQHSVLYRVDGRGDSVKASFFIQGNVFFGKGVANYDFVRKRDIYLFHFDPQRTAEYCHGDVADRDPLGEWCMTMWDSFVHEYNLLDGFANIRHIPQGATCVVAMCSPSTLPLEFFAERRGDLKIVLYTAESPNARHAQQWTGGFLRSHFTHLLTFWEPLCTFPPPGMRVARVPHNARFLKFPKDAACFRTNTGRDKSVCMILENRDTQGIYNIALAGGLAIRLKALDYLRQEYVKHMRQVTVYGDRWADLARQYPNSITVGRSGPRQFDEAKSVDTLSNFTFAIVIENCDAEGYISEKLGDCFIAGTIPIYYGSPSAAIRVPEGCWIDLRRFSEPSSLQPYLDSLTDDDIRRFQQCIREKRQEFLEARGCDAVYEGFLQVTQTYQ